MSPVHTWGYGRWAAAAQQYKREQLRPARNPLTAAQHILFTGSIVSGTHAAAHSFTVLAGEGAPTVTGGFAKWRVIDRPQRVGVTVIDGYDPMTMDLPIMFDAISTYSQSTPEGIESAIETLEWMGGRGLRFNADNGVGHPGIGDSPLVQVFTTDGHGTQVPLIPAAYQTSNLYWVVSGIAWDANPDREASGNRVRQKATVSLTEYVSGPFATGPSSPAARAKARQGAAGQYETFRTTDTINTIKLVAARFAKNPTHEAAVAILAANKANKRIGTSINKKLPRHTPVRVPRAVIKHLI